MILDKKEWQKRIGKTSYRRIYNQISMRYRRFNNERAWKTQTVIDGLTFEQALQRAYDEALKRIELGLNPNTYKVQPKTESPELPKSSESPFDLLPESDSSPTAPLEEILKKLPKEKSEPYSDLELVISRAFGKSEEEIVRENKELEKAVNESLERQTQNMLCPKCHSSVCHCHENEEGE